MSRQASSPPSTFAAEVTVSGRAMELLCGAMAEHTADFIVRQLLRETDKPGSKDHERYVHPGDPFGEVVAAVWRSNKREAVNLIAEVLAQLRYHHPRRREIAGGQITLDELLAYLPFAMSSTATDDEADALIAYARAEVPGYFSSDVNRRHEPDRSCPPGR